MIFTHCSQFHNCILYTDKKVLHSILMLRLSFLKIVFTLRFFCRDFRMSDIIEEPPFDWFINL